MEEEIGRKGRERSHTRIERLTSEKERHPFLRHIHLPNPLHISVCRQMFTCLEKRGVAEKRKGLGKRR